MTNISGYLLVSKVLIATGMTLAITTVWGFLENIRYGGGMPAIIRNRGLVRRCSSSAGWSTGHRAVRAMKNRLKMLRAERDWSQRDLADKARRFAPERQRDRDRPLRPQPAARFRHRRDLFGLAIEEIFSKD